VLASTVRRLDAGTLGSAMAQTPQR
jgi:hypothetical protein